MSIEARMDKRLIEVMNKAIEYYQTFLENLRYGESDNEDRKYSDKHWLHNNKHNRFEYIAYNHSIRTINSLVAAFSHVFKSIRAGSTPLFLDAGCGAGNILLLAHIVGFKAIGLEIDRSTIKLGRKLLKTIEYSTSDIIYGDIERYKHYNIYDVIYYYQPMFKTYRKSATDLPVIAKDPMKNFLRIIANEMKVGALVIANGFYIPLKEDKRFREIEINHKLCFPMYEKVKDN